MGKGLTVGEGTKFSFIASPGGIIKHDGQVRKRGSERGAICPQVTQIMKLSPLLLAPLSQTLLVPFLSFLEKEKKEHMSLCRRGLWAGRLRCTSEAVLKH